MHGQQSLPLMLGVGTGTPELDEILSAFTDTGDADACTCSSDSDGDAPVLADDAADAPETATDGESEAWLTASVAAEALGVSVRRLRKLAAAGKLERRRDEGRTMFRLKPEAPAAAKPQDTDEGTGRADAKSVNPETNPGGAAKATDGDAQSTQPSGEKRATEGTVVLDENDVVYLAEEVVAEGLLVTNRELMKLVDSVLNRWSEVSRDRTSSSSSLQRALERALDVQQCLLQWQDHAAWLDQQLLQTRHAAARALDVADEVLATSWKGPRRRAALSQRVTRLRHQMGLD